MPVAGLIACGAFALVNGANDGGALVGVGLRVRSLPPARSLGILILGMVVAPLTFGTQVSRTLTERLVGFDGATGSGVLLAAMVAVAVVVGGLSARGLPTSITLSLIGALAGAGIGGGLGVSWDVLGAVCLFGLAAPLIGGMVGRGLTGALRGRAGRVVARQPELASVSASALQALAYGANDGQKILAVSLLLAVPVGGSPVLVAVLLGGLFVVGALIGVRTTGRRMEAGVLPTRAEIVMAAQVSSSAAVLVGALAGLPVSMTQALTGGLVGSGVGARSGRIRWDTVTRLALAWTLTLPLSMGLAAVLAAGALWWTA